MVNKLRSVFSISKLFHMPDFMKQMEQVSNKRWMSVIAVITSVERTLVEMKDSEVKECLNAKNTSKDL